MSNNMLVNVDVFNADVNTTTRNFKNTLLLSNTTNIEDSDIPGTPIMITSAQQLISDYPSDITVTSPEYLYALDFFGAEPQPEYLYVFGEASGDFTTMLTGLDEVFEKKWFHTIVPSASTTIMKQISDFDKSTTNKYVFYFNSDANTTIADNLANVKQYPMKRGYYVASDVEVKHVANIIGSRLSLLPGSSPWGAIRLQNVIPSTYTKPEKLQLVSTARDSSTGINIVTSEENVPIVYYGKAMDGITWWDYVLAEIVIDDYLRAGVFDFIVNTNTAGSKIDADDIGASLFVAEVTRILDKFVEYNIIYAENDRDVNNNRLFTVKVVGIENREITLEYEVYLKGAIIKADIKINLNVINGN